MKTILILAAAVVALSGCAAMERDAASMQAMEDPQKSWKCALYLADETVPWQGTLTVELRDGAWYNDQGKLVQGEYDFVNDIVLVRRNYRDTAKTMLHEMTHRMQYWLDEPFNETEAEKATRWMHHCWLFGGL